MSLVRTWCFGVFTIIATMAQAQTNISGIINYYTPVTAIANLQCNSQVSVLSANDFAVGSKVLIIQMKGAQIDISNTANFGDITAINSAGNYEFSRIAAINGTVITLAGLLVNTYDVNGFVQLIMVPEYTSANITGTLQAATWNGLTGGVLAFFVTSNLSFNANIDLTGAGFKGGYISNNPDGGCGSGSNNYFYNLYQSGGSWNSGGAMKGEGIATLSTGMLAGKGKLANGGGGGNKHNHGGGGGSCFTTGGRGGEVLQGCPIDGNMGIGGLSLASYIQSDHLFLGGGGGCGDYNDAVGSKGANGGGIVIIKAGNIAGNGYSIKCNGADETIIGTGIADGVGGGGGGGLVFLDVPSYSGTLYVEANGGYGGDQDPYYGCVGTGGGGGTGTVITAQSALAGNVTVSIQPGRAGMFLPSDSNVCSGNYYATPGDVNITGPLTNIPLIQDNEVGLVSFSLGNDTTLCAGTDLVLNPNINNNNVSYQWQDGSINPTYHVTGSGLYWVIVSNGNCSAADSININYSLLSFHITNDSSCNGDTLRITPPIPNVIYFWQDYSNLPYYFATDTGLYWVTVNNGICTASDSIFVYNAALLFNLGNDTDLCTGQTITLNPQVSNATYMWQDGSTNPTYIVTQPGVYNVQVSKGNCTATDTITVTYHTLPVYLGNDTSLCDGHSIILNPKVTGATYMWQDGSTLPQYTVTTSGLYWVQASTGSCSGRDNGNIIFKPNPIVDLGNDSILCTGNIVELNAFDTGATYLWNDGSVLASKIISSSGMYRVLVDLNGCSAADSVQITFIHSPEGAYLPADTSICRGDVLTLGLPCSLCYYNWQNGSHDSIFPVSTPGNYTVSVSNLCGQATYATSVNVVNCICRMFIPNVFTPNGDGVNDIFIPEYDCNITYYHMQVFDRWGEKVFESYTPTQGWDGYFKNHACPEAVYVYSFDYAAYDDVNKTNSFHKKGSLTLLR